MKTRARARDNPLIAGGLIAASVACAAALATIFAKRARRAMAYDEELRTQDGALAYAYRPLLV